MNDAVDEFLTSLVGSDNWNQQITQVRDWALTGQVEHLLAIAAALPDEAEAVGIDAWVQQSIRDSIIRALIRAPGLSEAEAALSIAMMPEPAEWPRRRWSTPARWHAKVAEFLAQWQPSDVLLALFERYGHDTQYQEMLACLVQEMALRGYAVIGAAADFWQENVVATQHPLGWLPTVLLAQEKMFPKYLPQRRLGKSHISWADPGLENDVIDPLPAFIDIKVCWEEAEVSPEEKAALETAVFDWTQNSNGRIASHIFHSDITIPAGEITPATVLALPLECLSETMAADLRLVPYPTSRALALLFCAASGGGAYTPGYDGAYGRLAAWQSAGTLAGAATNASIGQVASFISDCAWFSCRTKAGWFYDVAWDVGLLALRPDGRTLAALAATDTD